MSANNNKLLHIVDDDDAVRESLSMLFRSVGIDVQAHVDGKAFLDAYAETDLSSSGCIVMDIRMPVLSGVEVYRQLREKGCTIPVIFITGHGDITMAVQAMHEGAFDFIPKPFRDQDLIDRVTAAMQQSDGKAEQLAKLQSYKRRLESLTAREGEVMAMVVEGKANKVIAIDLGLSQRTVEIHRARVMEKMQVRSLAELVRINVTLETAQ